MDWAGLGRKRSWPDMKYLSRNILEVLRRTMETSSGEQVSVKSAPSVYRSLKV
jgi:hypothetical protein